MTIKVKLDDENSKFVLLDKEKEIGKMIYFINYGVLTLNHTRIDKEYENKNLGHLLVDFAIEYAEKNKLKVNSLCSFATKVLIKNKDKYGEDILAKPIDKSDKFNL